MTKKELVITLGIVSLAAGWKMVLLGMDAFPFNADEAVVALMAKHILAGARPIFFYGQAYMGSVDAYLVSAAFAILGQSVLAIRIVQTILYIGTIITTIVIGKVAFGSIKAGWLAGLILAVPTVNMTLYTTVSLGGYGEALLIGNLILWLGWRIIHWIECKKQVSLFWFFVFGFLIGLGLWANGITLIYSIPVSLGILIRFWSVNKDKFRYIARSHIWILVGFAAGSAPWWIYAMQNGLQALLSELLGNAVAVERANFVVVAGQHLVNLILLGLPALFGVRPPWEVRWLVLPVIPFILAFWAFVIIYFIKRTRVGWRNWFDPVLMAICVLFLISFIFSPFGVDPSGRYFAPLFVILALIAGKMLIEKISIKWQAAVISVLLIYHAWGTLECALIPVPRITTQFDTSTVVDTRYQDELIHFLEEQGEIRGYSNYWVSYPLAFLSNESLIFTPRLPYHQDLRYTSRDDRYPAYTQQVEQSEKVAYITTGQVELEQKLRDEFSRRGVYWNEKQIGDYRIFYGLSLKITPSDMMLYQPAVK